MTELNKGDMRFARSDRGWYDRLQMWTGTEWQDITPGPAASANAALPELAAQWVAEIYGDPTIPLHPITLQLVERAAQWGADQELEACCEWVSQFNYDDYSYQERLRAARRSTKPPSLKAQALALIDECTDPHGDYLDDNALAIIRRALESLPD